MSTTSGVNVLRYSALAFGVFYGFTHQRSITASQKAAAAQEEYDHKKGLIQKARAEYAKTKNPVSITTQKSGSSDENLMAPNFDLDAYFDALSSQKA